MIKIDESLIFKILDSLSNTYPNKLKGVSQILPDYENLQEIEIHLAYSAGKGLIELEEVVMSDGSVKFGSIRITSSGIDYLLSKGSK